jgi:hypothetical protein
MGSRGIGEVGTIGTADVAKRRPPRHWRLLPAL